MHSNKALYSSLLPSTSINDLFTFLQTSLIDPHVCQLTKLTSLQKNPFKTMLSFSWFPLGVGLYSDDHVKSGPSPDQAELRHANRTGPKIFEDVIPKEGSTGANPAKPSFGMVPSIKYNLLWNQYNFLVESHQKMDWLGCCQPGLLLVWRQRSWGWF